ncbi:MAG: Ubiquinone/menaquinone biosynthesis C-methyltransferase UbiE [Pseudomonadota bacterium]|jgi:uncharacterized protein YbaR (Trm112 family)/SAM-dependent methyltransferase
MNRITYANGVQEAASQRLQRIVPLLACPLCRGALVLQEETLHCQQCSAEHPVKNGVPVLLPRGMRDAGSVELSDEDRVSRHPYSQRAEEIIAQYANGLVLDLGAGGKLERRQNVIQIDIFRYPAVDVASSADCLPFADNTFDAVISQAVFEHLQYPELAMQEIRRVLKPGGLVKIDTAFLQPEHGYPYHFFNVTETGLLHWLRDFDVQWSGIEPHQHPKWALSWFLDVYLDYIGEEQAAVLRGISVGQLFDALQRHQANEPCSAQEQRAIAALDSIPPQLQKVLAAGVSVQALNRPKHAVDVSASVAGVESNAAPSTLNREWELAQLRAERQALREDLKVVQDKAEYLAQFYPSSSNVAQFAAAWADPLYMQNIGGNNDVSEHPFVSVVVQPTQVSLLLDSFFSLANQVLGGWELLLKVDESASPSVKKAVAALLRLDKRVMVGDQCNGEYVLHLPQGAVLAADALKEVITVARNRPQVGKIRFDEDGGHGFERLLSADDTQGEAHIPRVLVRMPTTESAEIIAHKASLAYLLEQNREVMDELQQLNAESPNAAVELRQLQQSVNNYLMHAGFGNVPSSPIKQWIRKNLPLHLYKALLPVRPPSAQRPFVSVVLQPMNALALINTFASLLHQTYTGWELVLVEAPAQNRAVRRAILDFAWLDARVKIVPQSQQASVQGIYAVRLVDGVTLAFDAVEQVVTLVQAMPEAESVMGDFDYVKDSKFLPMRCHNRTTLLRNEAFCANFYRSDKAIAECSHIAYIPRCLFHKVYCSP